MEIPVKWKSRLNKSRYAQRMSAMPLYSSPDGDHKVPMASAALTENSKTPRSTAPSSGLTHHIVI
jgi:hypothetical protein